MTITFSVIWVPSSIVIFWALFIVKDEGGILSGMGNAFALIPAMFVSMISWIIYALLT